MNIVWDETKRAANLLKHGIDFADIAAGFPFHTALLRKSHSNRWSAIARSEAGVLIVVFAFLGSDGLSLISARRASRKERMLYDAQT